MIETDKSGTGTGRDMRRGGTRFSRQIKQYGGQKKLVSGLNGVVSRKERIKRLSAVNKEENCEMGFHELHLQAPTTRSVGTSKKFKLPSKFLVECNGVDHSSVPRKLRSATKKRNRESISPPFPDSKKLNQTSGGLESPNKRDCVKKSKMNMKQGILVWSSEENACGPITKDEEEVVETLYALAGMFPDSGPNSKNELDNASLDELPEASEGTPTLEDKDLKSECSNECADPALGIQKSLKEIVTTESTIQEQPDQLDGEAFLLDSGRSIGRAKQKEGEPGCSSVGFSNPHKPNCDTCTTKQPSERETPLSNTKPDIFLGLATASEKQLDYRLKTEDSDKNGDPVLCSGLSTTWRPGPSSQLATVKIPFWLDSTICSTRPGSWKNCSSNGKVKVNTDSKSWKRCAIHVKISQFIRLLQKSESKLCQGAIMMINDLNGMKNESNGVTSASGVVNITENNSIEARTGIPQHQRLSQNQPQASLASGAFTSQKQSFDFLSLLVGGTGQEATDTFSGTGNGLESFAQVQHPYIHPQVQHPTIVLPFSMLKHTTAYPDQPSAAAPAAKQVQLQPTYLGNPFYGSSASNLPLTKQQLRHHQQLQQKKQLWAAQMLAQYRNIETSLPVTHFPSWQNSQELPRPRTCAQAIIPSTSPTDVLSSKNYQASQQQHPITFPSSLPHSRVRKQDRHLSSVYEETGGGLRAGGPLALQLLCNDGL